jgi:hypothetical protein
VATFLTLLYVPALYLIVQDITNLVRGRKGRADVRKQMTEDR